MRLRNVLMVMICLLVLLSGCSKQRPDKVQSPTLDPVVVEKEKTPPKIMPVMIRQQGNQLSFLRTDFFVFIDIVGVLEYSPVQDHTMFETLLTIGMLGSSP